MDAYSLYDLNEYVRRVIALNFPEPLWISAEISQCKIHRGQAYLELVQQDEESGEIIARASAAIWYKTYLFLSKKLKELMDSLLKEGTQVLIKVRIDYNEKYGMKLVIEDIDPSYTIGQMEMERTKIIERLISDKLYDVNKEVDAPIVFQRLAVISSAQAAGYKDFIAQLENNPYGYAYTTTLFPAAMQGQNVEREVITALEKVKHDGKYDGVLIIRGGGSKLDLSYFDNYNIAASIASLAIPCLVGIGHEIDESVTDLVSYKSLKTPTAVADYLIDHSLHFEGKISHAFQEIQYFSRQKINLETVHLESLSQQLKFHPQQLIFQGKNKLDQLWRDMLQDVQNHLRQAHHFLDQSETIIKLSDPEVILKRGYAIIKNESGIVVDGNDLTSGDGITIVFRDTHKNATIDE